MPPDRLDHFAGLAIRPPGRDQTPDVLEQDRFGSQCPGDADEMLEQFAPGVADRKHLARTAERLTRRAARHQVGNPILPDTDGTESGGVECLDICSQKQTAIQIVALRIECDLRFPVCLQRGETIGIGIDGTEGVEPGPFESDIKSARATK